MSSWYGHSPMMKHDCWGAIIQDRWFSRPRRFLPGAAPACVLALACLARGAETPDNILRTYQQKPTPANRAAAVAVAKTAPLRLAVASVDVDNDRALEASKLAAEGSLADYAWYTRGRALALLCHQLSDRISEIEAERARRVRARIDRKIAEEIRPNDLFYQILHGLRSLTSYDHSSAVLMLDRATGELELVAEQVAWSKGKSRRIGLAG